MLTLGIHLVKAVEWIAKREGDTQPFFMYFATSSPHACSSMTWLSPGSTKVVPYGDYVAQTDSFGVPFKRQHRNFDCHTLKTYGFEDNTTLHFPTFRDPITMEQ